jgi:lipopolysaccharide biosynthesis protein/GT2 family glycosyltransferase
MSSNPAKRHVASIPNEPADILRACLSPACFWPPQQLAVETAWLEHAPFAFWLIETLHPRTLVELGTQAGYSYFSFCQAVQRLELDCRCYAVDTWKGDEYTGHYEDEVYEKVRDYHDQHYSSFSRLMRTSFDEAINHFPDGSIDLIHIDGSHFYDDVKHDFGAWRRKLSDRGVVLFHDTNERKGTFGVFRLWAELVTAYPHFEFLHGHGLGILGVGTRIPASLSALFAAARDQGATAQIRGAYSRLGSAISLHVTSDQQKAQLEQLTVYAQNLQRDLATSAAALKFATEQSAHVRTDLLQHQSELKQRIAEEERLKEKLRERLSENQILHKELAYEQLYSRRLRTDLAKAKVGNERLKGGFARAAIASEDLHARLQELAAKSNALQSELQRRLEEHAALRLALEQRSAQIEDLTSSLEQRTTQVNDLTSTIEQRTTQIDNLTSALEQRTTQVDDLTSALEQRTTQVDDLTSALKQRITEVGAMHSALEERFAQDEALRFELELRSQQSGGLETMLARETARVQERDAQIADATARLNAILASTSWRITRPLRRGLNKLPDWVPAPRVISRLRRIFARRRDARLIAASQLFDRTWYLEHYPDVRAAGADPVRHYLQLGALEGLNPSAAFDTQWYLAQYPDVAALRLNPLIHYLRHGASEGRQPNKGARETERRDDLELLACSELFDRDWYLDRYPDVREAGMDPALHYLEVGASEGRDPSAAFDTQWYLTEYADIAGTGLNPLVHYLRHGASEGRRPKKTDRPEERRDDLELLACSELFDRDWYLDRYPDAREAGMDPALHYLEVGASEGRDPSAAFDTQWYLTEYADIAGTGLNPLVHYLRHGASEGRQSKKTDRPEELRDELALLASSPLFDRDWYLDRYPDVREADMDPALHYLTLGASEGRDPSAAFDTQRYLAEYPDIAGTGLNPLVHYLRHGASEGRQPKKTDRPEELRDELELLASSPLFDRDWYLDRYPDVREAGMDPALHYLTLGASEGRNPSASFDTQWYLAQYPDVAGTGLNVLVHYLRDGASEGRQPKKIVQSELRGELELLASSPLFDRNWYLERYPDVRESGMDPALHYLELGAAEGRDPSAAFDTQWYLAQCPDVAASGTNPLVHYLRDGASEGRQPKRSERSTELRDELELLASSALFDRDWYLGRYPDVGESGMDPTLHYLKLGAAECRDPSAAFDTQWYLAQYPDVGASGMNPLVHYLRQGANEGRHPNDNVQRTERADQVQLLTASELFDREWYLDRYPDVREASADPVLHYLDKGAAEGRDPSTRFETRWYCEQYPDVASSGLNPLVHYLRNGAKEGRRCTDRSKDVQRIEASGLFDRTWYLEQYPDVRNTGMDPVLHYIEAGGEEGRDPSPLFDTRWYLAHYPDIAARGLNPLLHYLRHGAKEGRRFNDTTRQGDTISKMELIVSSHLFDRDWYLDRYPDVRTSGVDPILHYLEQGAAEGRNPSRLFDTRWYLSQYRDIALNGWNPLVHYVLHGAAEGRRPAPPERGGLASEQSSFIGQVTDVVLFCRKRPRPSAETALFVTHSGAGDLKPHIRPYIEALHRHGIRVVLIVAADSPLEEADASLIDLLEGLYVRQNVGFDFAAWAHVLRDNPDLLSGEILYLINDSVIGPLNERKFQDVLQRIRDAESNVVGLTDNYERGWHIQSYFLALRSKALASDALRSFFAGVKNLSVKQDVINEYEVCLTPALEASGLSCEALFPAKRTHNTSLLEWKALIRAGNPFVKIAALREAMSSADSGWQSVLQSEGFDANLAEEAVRAPTVAALWPIPRLAVLLHAYYVETLPIFQEYLERIRFPFTLFVSTDTEEKKRGIEQEFVAWENGRIEVRVMENRGRDTAPKLVGFRDVYDEYPYVLQLHSKQSLHEEGLTDWLRFLLDSLLGSHEAVVRVFLAFERSPDLGMVAPTVFAPNKPFMVWAPNFDRCRSLTARMGVSITTESPLDFPAGSMFWARSAALRPLLDLDLSFEDFPAEAGQTDGTLAHAIERLYFYSCELAGFYWTRDVLSRGRALLPEGTPRRPTPSKVSIVAASGESPIKDAFRQRCREALDRSLTRDARLALPTSPTPQVSVVLVLHNQAELTFETLRSLVGAIEEVPSEVIIVDNGSSDETGELCARLDGACIVRNCENLHFLQGVNQAVSKARGDSLLLLNNDTRIARDAIRVAHDTLHAQADIGAVGGRIILLDGTLQEAGSIVWRDGTCLGYGRGRDPREAEFQFRRDVDYCSAAFLMTRRALFNDLNGFDCAFAPAYYEETDLCMRIRAAGYRIVYEPRVQVSHFEFGSSSSSEKALELQRRNRAVFERRHHDTLQRRHLRPQSRPLEARMHGQYKGRILYIDDRVPFPSHGAGFPRTNHMLRAIHAAGWFVTFYPLRHPGDLWCQSYDLLPRDVEIMADHGRYGLEPFLRERIGYYDVLLVSRPHNMEAVQKALRAVPGFLDSTRLVYDAEALIAPREAMRLALEDASVDEAQQKQALKREIDLAAGAMLLIAVNEREAAQFRAATTIPVRVIGHRIEPAPTPAPFEARADILFVGLLDRDGSPNVDSIEWFVHEVMPELDRLIGAHYKLKLAGRNAGKRIQSLAGLRIELLGRVDDLMPCYDATRLFIAPTRYAAGLPQKVHEAAAFGVPCVTTRLIAQQLGWKDGIELRAADMPKDFAAACARLYTDGELWARLRGEALKRVAQDCNPADFASRVAEVLGELSSAVLQQGHSKTPYSRVNSSSWRSIPKQNAWFDAPS